MADEPKRARIKTWLHERIISEPRAQEDWIRILESGWDELLGLELRVLLPKAEVIAWFDAYLDPEHMAGFARALYGAALKDVISEMKADAEPLRRFVPREAEAKIESLLERPQLVDPEWIKEIFRGAAVEAVVSDTLYRALRDFSTIVPRLMSRLSPVGRLAKLGGAGSMATRIAEGLERIIEPEIKTFLATGTQRALDRAARFAIDHMDDPASIASRKQLLQFVLDRAPSFHAGSLSVEIQSDVEQIAALIGEHLGGLDHIKTRTRSKIEEVAEAHGKKTLKEALEILGIKTEAPMAAWARLTWPTVRELLSASATRTWLDGLVDEILDQAEV